MSSPIRILLVDDHCVVREGLARLLEEDNLVEIVGQASNGEEALSLAATVKPDLVLMDLNMPITQDVKATLSGVEVTRRFTEHFPTIKVLILTMYDAQYAQQTAQAGAVGYVQKNISTDNLLRSIVAVYNGMTVFPPPLQPVQESLPTDHPRLLLTAREIEVLQWLARGQSARATARILHIEAKTVETHRQHIREKTGLKTIAELTRYAIKYNLV